MVSCAGITEDKALPYSNASFTKVLSVDAAYHFNTRARFVSEAARVRRLTDQRAHSRQTAVESLTAAVSPPPLLRPGPALSCPGDGPRLSPG
eukprot:COSAG01_NODE_5215_length_4406_cov_2.137683_4_plen_92_part_00